MTEGRTSVAAGQHLPGVSRPPRDAADWADVALTGLGLAMLAALAAFRIYQYWAYEVDDAFITIRSAHLFAAGHGFVYNPGGPRVEAHSSHWVWMLQVGAAWLTGGYALLTTRVAGVMGFAACVVCAAGMARDLVRWSSDTRVWGCGARDAEAGPLSGASPPACRDEGAAGKPSVSRLSRLAVWSGASTLVSTNILATGAVSGLETTLFAGLVAAACWGFMRLAAGEGAAALVVATGLAAGFATWTRPEGIAWAVGLGGFAAVVAAAARAGGTVASSARRPLTALFLALAFWGLLTVFRLVIYGQFHPNPFYAKLGRPAAERLAGGVAYLNGFVVHHLGWVLLAGAIAGVLLVRGHVARGAAAILLAGAAGHLGVTVWEGGDWIPHLRFVAPALAPLAALISAALGLAVLRLGPRRALWISAGVSWSFAVLFLWAAQTPNRRATDEIQTRVYGWYDAHVPLGKWLAAWNEQRVERGGEALTVALEDIGFVGLLSGAQIIDLAGLADPDWARMIYLSRGRARYPTQRLVHEQRPEVIVLTAGALPPQGGPRWMNPTVQAIATDPDFRERYLPRAVYAHKHFPGDGYYLHVFVRADVVDEPPLPPDPPRPRAWAGWDTPPPR